MSSRDAGGAIDFSRRKSLDPGRLSVVGVKPQTKANNGSRCSLGALLDRMRPNALESIQMILGDRKGWKNAEISRVLQAGGHEVTEDQVKTHRREKCGCPPRQSEIQEYPWECPS
jgi:hypothetical protein